ncbi:MAG: hypothetical protein FWE83_01290 [Oscillospiraceae bacterium]|nr:hypothetical protein [Oscillospiraceae bacterium]
MISNVQLNAATQVNTVGKVSDDLPVNEIEEVTVGVTEHDDRVEISNKAHTASQNSQIVKEVAPMSRDFLEVFSVNFWSHGTEK